MQNQEGLNFLQPDNQIYDDQLITYNNQTRTNFIWNLLWISSYITVLFIAGDKDCDSNIKTLLIIRALIRIWYNLPAQGLLYLYVNKGRISAGKAIVITRFLSIPLIGWYIYTTAVFYSSSNNWRDKSLSLWIGHLLLLIESFWYLIFWCLISIIIWLIWILTIFLQLVKGEEKKKSMKIRELLSKAKWLKMSPDELIDGDEWSICFNEFEKDQQVIKLPWNDKHFFHSDWIWEWVGRKSNCPLWKFELTKDVISNYNKKRKNEKSQKWNKKSESKDSIRVSNSSW